MTSPINYIKNLISSAQERLSPREKPPPNLNAIIGDMGVSNAELLSLPETVDQIRDAPTLELNAKKANALLDRLAQITPTSKEESMPTRLKENFKMVAILEKVQDSYKLGDKKISSKSEAKLDAKIDELGKKWNIGIQRPATEIDAVLHKMNVPNLKSMTASEIVQHLEQSPPLTHLSGVDINTLVDRLSKVTPSPEMEVRAEQKEVVTAILNKLQESDPQVTRVKREKLKDKIDEIKLRFAPKPLKREVSLAPETSAKLARGLEKAKMLGKGLSDPKAKAMNPFYWLEVFKFNINGKEVNLYANALTTYYKEWKESGTTQNFEEYMQDKIDHMGPEELSELEKNVLVRLSEEGRKEHEVSFAEDGTILQNGQPVADGEYIFTMEADSKDAGPTNLYIGQKVKGKFQHSSFFAGGAVRSAGMMDVENGRIKSVKAYSGHYLPPAEMMDQVLDFVEAKAGKGVRDEIDVVKLKKTTLKLQGLVIKLMGRFNIKSPK